MAQGTKASLGFPPAGPSRRKRKALQRSNNPRRGKAAKWWGEADGYKPLDAAGRADVEAIFQTMADAFKKERPTIILGKSKKA